MYWFWFLKGIKIWHSLLLPFFTFVKPHKKQEPYRACNKLSCCKRENGTQSRETNFNMLNIFSWHVPVIQPVNKQNCLCQSCSESPGLLLIGRRRHRGEAAPFNEIIKLRKCQRMNQSQHCFKKLHKKLQPQSFASLQSTCAKF